MGGGRGGIPGGRGGPSGGQRGGRGPQMSGSRGGMAGGRGRGGGSGFSGAGNAGSSGRGGGGGVGGGSSGSLRAHGSRGNFGNKDYQHRRGGGSGGGGYNHQGGSFRGRGGHTGSNRTSRHDGGSNIGSRDGQASSSFVSAGKKDENRRTLTDFKIVGLEIRDLSWTWGVLPQVTIKPKQEELDGGAEILEATAKDELMDEDVETKTENAGENPIQTDPSADQQSDTLDTIGLDVGSSNPERQKTNTQDHVPLVSDPPVQEAAQSTVPLALTETGAYTPPPSRIRIYFHTPVTADDARPIPHNSSSFSFSATPSDSRKGKRKKLADDDGDLEEERTRPPPPQMTGINDDRSSVASVAPSAAETVSEADWLMAAIVEGGEDADADVDLVGDDVGNDAEEDAEQWHVSQLVATHDTEDVADGAQDVDAPAADGEFNMPRVKRRSGVEEPPHFGGSLCAHTANLSLSQGDLVDVDMVSADGGVAAPVAIEAGVVTQDGGAFAIDGTMPVSVAPDNSLPVATAAPEPEQDTVHLNGPLSAARDAESRSFIDDLPQETTLHVGSSLAPSSGAGPSASTLPDLSVSTSFLPSPSSILSAVSVSVTIFSPLSSLSHMSFYTVKNVLLTMLDHLINRMPFRQPRYWGCSNHYWRSRPIPRYSISTLQHIPPGNRPTRQTTLARTRTNVNMWGTTKTRLNPLSLTLRRKKLHRILTIFQSLQHLRLHPTRSCLRRPRLRLETLRTYLLSSRKPKMGEYRLRIAYRYLMRGAIDVSSLMQRLSNPSKSIGRKVA